MSEEANDILPLFEKYVKGTMNEAEKAALEAQFVADPAQEQAFTDYLRSLRITRLAGRQEQKATFEEMFHAYKRKRRTQRAIFITAIAAGIILLAMIFLPAPQQLSTDELYAKYYEAPAAKTILDIEEDSIMRLLRLADANYNEGNFAAALQQYESLALDSLSAFERSRVNLLRGICFLEAGEVAAAQQALLRADQHTEKAPWFLALSYVKSGDTEQAKQALTPIAAEEGNFYQKQAKELLEDLE